MTRRIIDRDKCPWVDVEPYGRTLTINQFVTARVNAVAKALNRSSARLYLSRFDLTVPEWRILANIEQREPCAARDLIEHISMDKALISRTIKRLQQRGFLEVRANPADRRTSTIALTREGIAMYRKLLPSARRRQAKLIESLTKEERQVLWRALSKLQWTAETLSRIEEESTEEAVAYSGEKKKRASARIR